MLKKCYANVILKSQQVLGKAFDGEKMKKNAKFCEKQSQEQKPYSQLERDRKAARIAIESIKGRFILMMLFKPKENSWPSSVLRVVGKRVYIFYVVNKLV
ncbi:hypothetical protein MTR67_002759 [Solanum verrucosum]|uniref:Uncharacterized protein n=1 Tax=Solanum verrucosum TaxID=315347 RepID=A0AAF0PQT4_SOLVR|nr:hypothetical protein MTR67_002759 [Solanum verrucosum]